MNDGEQKIQHKEKNNTRICNRDNERKETKKKLTHFSKTSTFESEKEII